MLPFKEDNDNLVKMLRWTGGTRNQAEQSRRQVGDKETFFLPEQSRFPLNRPRLDALSDATNHRAPRHDLTPKQVQRSVDAQALRWAVRSPPSANRQKKKQRVEQPTGDVTVPFDVSPIPIMEDPSMALPFDFPTPSGGALNSSSPFTDPHGETIPFQDETSPQRGSLFAPLPLADSNNGRLLMGGFEFQTGRQLLHTCPAEEQQHWQRQQEDLQRQWQARRNIQSSDWGRSTAYAAPQLGLSPSPQLDAPAQPSQLPHPLQLIATAGPTTLLPSTRAWAYPATHLASQVSLPEANPLFFTPL